MSSGPVTVPPGRTGEWDLFDRAALGVVVVIAAGLCLYRLAGRSIWYDEAAAMKFARELRVDRLPDGGNMAAYYLFLKAWLGLGDAEWTVRLPSVLFVAGSAAGLYVFARRLFDREAALLAAILLVTNASLVRYGQEARGYALELLFVVASWLVLAVALERRRIAWFVLYGLLAGLAVAVHMFAVFFLAAQVLSLLFLEPGRVPWRKVLIGLGVASLPVLPVFVVAVRAGTDQISWIPLLSARTVGQVFSFLVGMFLASSLDQPREAASLLLLAGNVAAWTAALVLAVRTFRRHGRSRQTWSYAATLLWFAVPLLLTFVVSATLQSLMSPRYFIAILPPSALLLGLALERVGNKVAKCLAVASLLTLNVVGLVWTYESGDSHWRDAVDYVMNNARPGDSVEFAPPYQQATFDYYAGRRDQGPTPALLSLGRALSTAERRPTRVWLVSTQFAGGAPREHLSETHEVARLLRVLRPTRLISFMAFGEVNVRLLELSGRSS